MTRKIRPICPELFVNAARLLAVASLLTACGRQALPSEGEPASNLALRLTVAPGVDVDRVNYRITGGGILPITGVMNLDTGTSLPVQLPAGSYTAELEATSRDGLVFCQGTNMFQVVAGASLDLAVVLDCRRSTSGSVAVNPTFNNCPVITAAQVSATSTSVGTPVTVTATATDADPGTALLYTWRAVGGGTFADGEAASTTYECGTAGARKLEVTATDGRCASTAQVDLACVPAAVCGNGVLEVGEGCEPPGTATCDASCKVIQQDLCAACLAINCEETPGCGGLTEPARVPLCQALLTCIGQSQCRRGANNTGCLCGTASPAVCTTEPGAANGPCLAEEVAAAESTDLATISARFTNPTYASGAAHSFLSCQAESCAVECGLTP